MKLVDFQLITNGSPVYDLSYCFYSSGNADSFVNLEKYLQIYHDSLCRTLRVFDLDAGQHYPFSTLKEEWGKYCKFGFAMTLFVSRLKLADEESVPDLKKYQGGPLDPFKIPVEKEESFKQNMRNLVLHMCSNNFLSTQEM